MKNRMFVLIHGPDETGTLRIDLPVHHRAAVGMGPRQSRRAKYDVVISESSVLADHFGADQISYFASCAVGTDQIIAGQRLSLIILKAAYRQGHLVRTAMPTGIPC